MAPVHLEILVEEFSMEVFLRELLARCIPSGKTFDIHSFQGKGDLLEKLPNRLKGYAPWLPADWRIVVVLDQDDDNCQKLKQKLEQIAQEVGLTTRTQVGPCQWQVVNRIVTEELEAWYFGDWQAVCTAYPKVNLNIPKKSRYRNPDQIKGGTREAFERLMKQRGYFPAGLERIEAARAIGKYIDPSRNRSRSFQIFYQALCEALREECSSSQAFRPSTKTK
ncbi:MAG: DUF4276 family protein [Thermoguttaceae bacterium]|nr:DUF4276 family protein [Thermoguttaceae bacterium]MDW8037088.1 DUF4276 family protein [Thermoguttaceae bacterium]